MTRIFIVPARMGSKRISGKNLRNFCGAPILSYPINQILDPLVGVEEIYVSTDQPESVREALPSHLQGDPKLSFLLRPAELSTDFASSVDVVRQVITTRGLKATDEIWMTYPTSVFWTPSDLIMASRILQKENQGFVCGVIPIRGMGRVLTLTSRGFVEFSDTSVANVRSQDLSTNFIDAAQLYGGFASTWLSGQPYVDCTSPIAFDSPFITDIDEERDWILAETVYASWLATADKSNPLSGDAYEA